MTTEGIHSTGRGGAGNIGRETEPTSYTDGSIVHEGVYGETQRPDGYSAGRGGAGNMGLGKSPRLEAVDAKGKRPEGSNGAGDVIPETAMRGATGGGYHTGRGGQGNARPASAQRGASTEGTAKDVKDKVEGKVKSLLGKEK
ncbi:hypothetical protein K461DRAFT_290877 [Myriangium duriaei CBS 260.36]|uniref:Uncharacterized protein n=1 Tax=Myriangium duriaei CBS 260.36 TaxID=1168546 RepID=A0A9P4J5Q8_9PEZI|nr:hypothetical protein K461DRAFT_290877 [Myriangium duriaei CBS 260.36]